MVTAALLVATAGGLPALVLDWLVVAAAEVDGVTAVVASSTGAASDFFCPSRGVALRKLRAGTQLDRPIASVSSPNLSLHLKFLLIRCI